MGRYSWRGLLGGVLFVILGLSIAAPAGAQEAPEQSIDELVQQLEKDLVRRQAWARERIAGTRAARPRDMVQQLKAIQEESARLADGTELPWFPFQRPLAQGQIGLIRTPVEVVQVWDQNSFLAEPLNPQMVDVPNDQLMLVRGVSTEDLVDGKYLDLEGPFRVAPNATFKTTLGGVATIRAFDRYEPPAELIDAWRARLKELKKR